ncbi:MAG: hypothetical protein V1793_04320 [Pseudomonadota bacterium]
MYRLFGLDPIPFHLAALVLHGANACLVALIVREVIKDRLVSRLTALIYASAVALHVDSLAWAVGIYDIGGAFFFFLSLLLFIKNKPSASAVFYFLGCLFKEAVLVLPIILFFYPLLTNSVIRSRNSILEHMKHLAIFIPPMVIIAGIKLAGQSPLDFNGMHPYALELTGVHVIKNLIVYPIWMFQAFFPFMSAGQLTFQLLAIGIALVLLYGIHTAFQQKDDDFLTRRIMFLFVWLFAGLLPVFFLRNHLFRYYGIYSLPAFITSFLVLFRYVLCSLHIRGKAVPVILIFICSLAVTGSVFQSNRIYAEGLNQTVLTDGTNGLIRKAAYVDIVSKGLKRYLPNPPSNSILIFDTIDIWSFNKNSGPQVWYNDTTLGVLALGDLKDWSRGPDTGNPVEIQTLTITGIPEEKKLIVPSRFFFFGLSHGQLNEMDQPIILKRSK